MSDRIADIVRRDLDALPVLPQDRWLPPKSGSRRAWSALFLGIGALAVLTAAVVVGGALRASRSTALESVPPASRATTAPSLRITRQDVLARGQTFDTWKWATLILLNIAIAPIGGLLALWLTGTHFSVSSGIGFLALFGVSVQTGVIMLEYINQLRMRGLPVREAAKEGA